MNLDRRTALTGALAATGTLTLAACAQEPEPATTTPPSATVETSEAMTGEVVSNEQLLGTVDEIMIGSGKKFEISGSLTILVTRPTADVFRAFNASCTHAGCIVTGVKDDQIACGCHGARFNPESGEPEAGPAKSALGKILLEVRGADLYALI